MAPKWNDKLFYPLNEHQILHTNIPLVIAMIEVLASKTRWIKNAIIKRYGQIFWEARYVTCRWAWKHFVCPISYHHSNIVIVTLKLLVCAIVKHPWVSGCRKSPTTLHKITERGFLFNIGMPVKLFRFYNLFHVKFCKISEKVHKQIYLG